MSARALAVARGRRARGLGALAALLLVALPAHADPPDAGGAGGGPADGGSVWSSCIEHLPPGAIRPVLHETFPTRGFSGYAASLEISIVHGKGETVLPAGFKVQGGSDPLKALELSGFHLPDPDGGAGPTITLEPSGSSTKTTVVIPFVPLPKDPGRNAMVLPPVPIAVSRASGEVVTVCTAPHRILVEDPIANELDPKVKPSPPARPQSEEWVLLEELLAGGLAGLVLAALGAWLWSRWARRPKQIVLPPPKLPWVLAMEELEEIRRSSLLADAQSDTYFDRVSDTVRKYLGARYGFDGLETTSDEMRALLKRVRPPVPELPMIGKFLDEADLVKFARVLPGEEDCLEALRRGEAIVRMTIPAAPPVLRAVAAPPPAAPLAGAP